MLREFESDLLGWHFWCTSQGRDVASHEFAPAKTSLGLTERADHYMPPEERATSGRRLGTFMLFA